MVQFGTRSMSSTAVESGNMLDIKTMCPLTEGTLDAPRLLPAGLLCRTMAEASARREAFLAGAEVCETKREVCLQCPLKKSHAAALSHSGIVTRLRRLGDRRATCP